MKQPKNLTLSDSILAKANALIAAMDADTLSNLVTILIREEHERRHGPAVLRDAPPGGAGPPTSYLKKRK